MAAPQSKTVVIVCPHCTTRYQVPGETVGSKGRQVQCAHCGKTWQAFAEKIIEPKPAPSPPPAVTRAAAAKEAEDDRMFDAAAEAELDAAFEAEQKASAEAAAAAPAVAEATPAEPEPIAPRPSEPAPKPADTAADKKRQKAFSQRQSMLVRQLPMARVRRTARIAGVTTLVALLVGGYVFRTDVVRLFPDLAGTYAMLGMEVNVVGLEFRDVQTLLVRHDGTDVMQVDAQILSVASGPVSMPPVVVTLVNDDGLALYEWSVAPSLGVLEPGQITDFSSKVNAPPNGATKVRLSFGTGQAQAPSLMTPAEPAAAMPAADHGTEPAHEPAAHAAEPAAADHAAEAAHEPAAQAAADTHEAAPAHAAAGTDHSGDAH